jgi:hypothetical protein
MVSLMPQGGQQQETPKPKLETPAPPKVEILPPGEPQVVSVLSFDGAEFIKAFNATADRPRIVIVLAPTCGHCVAAGSQVRSVLNQMPNAKVKVFIMWTPIMPNDSRRAAITSSAYIPDPRVEQYWDLWAFASKAFTATLPYKEPEFAWDMLVLYKPHLIWRNGPPEPTLFLENRGQNIAKPISAETVKAELEKWAQ